MHTTPLRTDRPMGIQSTAPINKPRLPAPERVTIQQQQQGPPRISNVSSSSSSPKSSPPQQMEDLQDKAKADAALAKLIADTAAANSARRHSTFVDTLPAPLVASQPKKIATGAGTGVGGKKKSVGFNFSQNLPVHMRSKTRVKREPISRGVKMLIGSRWEVVGTARGVSKGVVKRRAGWDKRGGRQGDGEEERKVKEGLSMREC